MRRLAWAGAAPFLAWWGVWLGAASAGVGVVRRSRDASWTRPVGRLDVLIPAHDEEHHLPDLLRSLGLPRRTEPGVGRVLVVADHCTDATARLAESLGAEVLRRDSGPRGKPAALRDGMAWYRRGTRNGAGLLFVDADCRCSPHLAAHVLTALERTPVVQTANLVGDGDGDAAAGGVALGMHLRNLLRPAGLSRMGFPVMLSGTGMAVRADHLHHMHLGDELAEDLVLSRALLAAGVHVGFVPAARVTSDAPPDRDGLTAQRERWEGGTLRAMAGVPGVAVRLALRGDWRGMVTLTDASAPPLALGVAAWGVGTSLAALAAVATRSRGPLRPFGLAAGCLAAYLAVGATSARGPRGVLHLARTVPGFLGWKLGVYRRMARGEAATAWVRTPRATDAVRTATATKGN